MKQYITVKEFMARYGLSERAVRHEIALGNIPVTRIGRNVRIPIVLLDPHYNAVETANVM